LASQAQLSNISSIRQSSSRTRERLVYDKFIKYYVSILGNILWK
jgi:hypothetical protein